MRQELGPSGARHGDGVGASELEERPENLHCVGSILGGFISRVSPNLLVSPRLSAINSPSGVHCGVFFCVAFFFN